LAKEARPLLALPERDEEKTDRQFITALARGLEVLRAFQPGDGWLGNQEIAARTKLPKPTVARITHTLTALGYLEYNRRLERHSLGTPVLALGYACLSNIGVRTIARPRMQELANQTNGSVALGSRDRLNMTYIELAHGNATVALRLEVGARLPIYRTAMGMAYLSALPESEQRFLIDAIKVHDPKEFPRFKKQLNKAFREIEKDGYCAGLGTFERTLNGVGAPLRMRDGSTIYGLNCSGPAFQFTEERIRSDIGPRLVVMARNIEADMLHHPIKP